VIPGAGSAVAVVAGADIAGVVHTDRTRRRPEGLFTNLLEVNAVFVMAPIAARCFKAQQPVVLLQGYIY
jgi:hypothetical protein